jgi:hypothetical protein
MKYPLGRWSCTTRQGNSPSRLRFRLALVFVGLVLSTKRQSRFLKCTRFWPRVAIELNRRTMRRRTPNCSPCAKPDVAVAIGDCPLERPFCTPPWSRVRCVGPPRTLFAWHIWSMAHVTCDSEPSSSLEFTPPTAQLIHSTLHRPWPP